MSSAQVSSSVAPRKRSSIACQRCRQRKVKCDAQGLDSTQPCTQCVDAGYQCHIDSNGDRRKVGSRRQIESLQARIRKLESMVARNDAQMSRYANAPPSTLSEDVQPVSPSTEQSKSVSDAQAMARMPSFGLIHPTASRSSPQAPSLESDAYFGLTSHLHVRTSLDPASKEAAEESAAWLDSSYIPDMQLDKYSAQLRESLLRVYFEYQLLWLCVVHKTTFLAHRAHGVPSQWYSQFLESVLLACAARLSTSSAVRSLCHAYAHEARSNILQALENPSPASLQGFIMLSEFEVTQGNDRAGWMFCGIACRMILDLGLHCKMQPPPPSVTDGDAMLSEANLYYLLLCASLSYEGIWCLYLGRASSIPRPISDAVLESCKQVQSSISKMAIAWVGLLIPMAEVNDILNNIVMDETAVARLRELDRELEIWHESLPSGVRYVEGKITDQDQNAYGLQMQYCKVRILLHQAPLLLPLSLTRGLSLSSSSPQQEFTIVPGSDLIIYEHAVRIAKLLLTYGQLFGWEKISSIMLDNANLAATTIMKRLLYRSTPALDDSEDKKWLRSIVSTLEAVQQHFPITKRMVSSLRLVADGTHLSTFVQASCSLSYNVMRSPAEDPIDFAHALDAPISLDSPRDTRRPSTSSDKNAQTSARPQFRSPNRSEGWVHLTSDWLTEETPELAGPVLSWPGMEEFMTSFLPLDLLKAGI